MKGIKLQEIERGHKRGNNELKGRLMVKDGKGENMRRHRWSNKDDHEGAKRRDWDMKEGIV